MPKPRSTQVSLGDTPYYHCVSRCVRRAFLCGQDRHHNFEHRRGWIEDKLLFLSSVFAIKLCAYAVMSNHYHTVLWVNAEESKAWSDKEVVERWHQVFSGNLISQQFLQGKPLESAQQLVLDKYIALWRERLTSISWYMRVINEDIARRANAEDKCTGRFWEGRFKCQALLDEKALAACMVYVDLNPVRAGMAKTPESSEHTSVKRRIEKAEQVSSPKHPNQQTRRLHPFVGNPRESMPDGLPFRLTDYLALVDQTGRVIRHDKRGSISPDTLPIIDRLDIDPEHWLYMTQNFESLFKGFVGTGYLLKAVTQKMGYQRTPGYGNCSHYLS